MGANNFLPTVPTFTAGSPTISQLNSLAYATSFLVDMGVRPYWSLFMFTGTQAVVANTWTTVLFDHIAYDSDGVAAVSKSQPSIVTQGYYALNACVQIEANANTGDMFTSGFLFTAGANNPHFTLAATQFFGYRAGKISSTAQAVADNAYCLSDITPMVCYPGDTLAVQVYISLAHTLDINANTSYIQGRFATKFGGLLVRTGT